MAADRPSIVKGRVAWKVDTGAPVPAPPREVFDAWLDGALEALGETKEGDSAVRAAIRKELEEWLAS